MQRITDVELMLKQCVLIDAHAHVSFSQFDHDRPAVIKRAGQAGIGWIEIGTDVAQSRRAIRLAQLHDNTWATVGVHPSDIASLHQSDWSLLEILLHQPKVVAVGEVGIDVYHTHNLAEQLAVLRRFITLAVRHNLPVVFHVRSNHDIDAHDELIKLLASLPPGGRPRGVVHTFSGTQMQAERYLELGLYLSFSGVITFKNPGETVVVAQTTPPDRILIETDCPFLAPEPCRGQRNEPAYVQYVAHRLAQIKGLTEDEIARQTAENTRQLFGIDQPWIRERDKEQIAALD